MALKWGPALAAVIATTSVLTVARSSQVNLQEMVQKIVAFHRNWGDKMSTPGASIVAVEDNAKKLKSDSSAKSESFLIKTIGLPKDKIYQLAIVTPPNFQPLVQISGIGLNSEGIAVCPGKPDTCSSEDGPDDPIDLRIPAAKGQVFHFALVSADGSFKAMFTIIPSPIRAADRGCQLELQRLMPKAELVYLVASGFKPETEIEFASDSGAEHQSRKTKIDASGKYESALMPAVQGKSRGTLNVKIASATCSPSASIDWGEGSDKPQ